MDWLKVTIDPKANMISVYHNGVPVEFPELIFSDDNVKKTTGGRNSYLLTNILPTEFVIEIADGRSLKKYKQVFENNMGKKYEPVITNCNYNENWTMVTFKPDLNKFKMDCLEKDVVALMKKRVLDMAGCLGKTVMVELNGTVIPLKSFKDYAEFFLKCAEKSKPTPLPRIHAKLGDRLEICVSLSDGEFQQVSFVNSIATIKGGTHVDYITKQITTYIKKEVKKKMGVIVNAHLVKNHLWVFVNALIDNPAFDSQTKEKLTTKSARLGLKFFPDAMLNDVEKSGILDTLLPQINLELCNSLFLSHTDAKLAGGSDSGKCTLILTQGESVKAIAMSGLSFVDQDLYGVFPLRSNLLNVREGRKLIKKEEIQNLMSILGLKLNKEYSNTKCLRYGRLMIMVNQDDDGSHIKGLLISFIHSFWPSLLKVDPSFMVVFTTPIIKASHSNGKKLSFYSMPKYEAWKKKLGNTANDWEIKYRKGLITNTKQEVREYFEDLDKHIKHFVWEDKLDGISIDMAFSKKAEERKAWICNFQPGTCDYEGKHINYKDFVNKEFLFFSMKNLHRSIPSMVDGLTLVQRKTLFCSFKMNLTEETEVCWLVCYVIGHSDCHYGEQSIASTIIGMADDFVGSNNINLLTSRGQFGRNLGGRDHGSSRNIYIKLNKNARFLFPVDDDKLLEYLDEEGRSIEPNWYIPIIPLVLVNGCHATGTCFSSDIPKYNPRDIINNVRRLLNEEEMVPMDPWYKGFRGTIKKSAKEIGYIVNGSVETINEQTFRITELPIRTWTQYYEKFLEQITDGAPNVKDPLIEGFRQNGDYKIVDIEVKMKQEKIATIKEEGVFKKFKLTSTVSTSNMHLFDAEGKIKKYNTPEQILEEFYTLRLKYYEKRKEYLVKNFQQLLLILRNKEKFRSDIVNGNLDMSNLTSAKLKQRGFSPIPKKGKSAEPQVEGAIDYSSKEQETVSPSVSIEEATLDDYKYLLIVNLFDFTVENLEKLKAERAEKENEYKTLVETSPKSMWLHDLNLFEKELDELEKMEEKKEKKRSSMAKKKNGFATIHAKKLPQPQKNTQKEADDDIPSLCHFESSDEKTRDSDDDVNVVDDDDFVVQEKAATTPKKRNVGSKRTLSQQLLTDMFPPAESTGSSPDRKVRKTRDSP